MEDENKNIFLEFLEFIRIRKKWWLVPVVIIISLIGLLIILGQMMPLTPFIYVLF